MKCESIELISLVEDVNCEGIVFFGVGKSNIVGLNCSIKFEV